MQIKSSDIGVGKETSQRVKKQSTNPMQMQSTQNNRLTFFLKEPTEHGRNWVCFECLCFPHKCVYYCTLLKKHLFGFKLLMLP